MDSPSNWNPSLPASEAKISAISRWGPSCFKHTRLHSADGRNPENSFGTQISTFKDLLLNKLRRKLRCCALLYRKNYTQRKSLYSFHSFNFVLLRAARSYFHFEKDVRTSVSNSMYQVKIQSAITIFQHSFYVVDYFLSVVANYAAPTAFICPKLSLLEVHVLLVTFMPLRTQTEVF